MKKHSSTKILIIAIMTLFLFQSLSPAQIVSENFKADDLYTPLVLVEPGSVQQSTLYADGSVIELQTETVTRPISGSDTSGITLGNSSKW